jgi:hypothetical protein
LGFSLTSLLPFTNLSASLLRNTCPLSDWDNEKIIKPNKLKNIFIDIYQIYTNSGLTVNYLTLFHQNLTLFRQNLII